MTTLPIGLGFAITPVGMPPSVNAAKPDTPIAALNRRLRQITAEWDALDNAALQASGTPEEDRLERAREANLREMLAPRLEARKYQATTVEDAVIQAVLSFYLLESVTVRQEDEADVKAVLTMLASVIRCLAEKGRIDLNEIGQADMADLCWAWAPGGRRAA